MLPLVPGLGTDFGQRRPHLGRASASLSFQPGEVAKIVLAIFFASYLVEKRELLAHGPRRSARSPCPTSSTSARSCSPGACRWW